MPGKVCPAASPENFLKTVSALRASTCKPLLC